MSSMVESTAETATEFRLPEHKTLQHAAKLAIVDDKPIMLSARSNAAAPAHDRTTSRVAHIMVSGVSPRPSVKGHSSPQARRHRPRAD